MKIVQNKLIPPKGFIAITLFGVVFARKELNETSKNHEAIHVKQGNEMLWVFFYLWYCIEWLIRLIQYRDKMLAYYNISFEREAYINQLDDEYLIKRKLFSWIKYL
ncbi:hypothetical protein [Dysgonomonas mossii]|uniref:DUF4157 domain-containing protein n=1 Tax=Dysgonomonas mossii DSM 22836 TaxID=742767 RepID=F8X4Z4_9BACT|nr:hypothetical protein [Dysgonomonas mossii]EGK04692.1 hypothetical protein HMPREF9456_03303 [Dysgonomonas mossii DSM 22836]